MPLDKQDKKWVRKTFRRYTDIIAEDFKDQIKPVIEMQESQGKLLKTTFDEVEKIKIKITEIKLRLDKIELRLDKIELRLNKVESRLGKVESDIKQLKETARKKENINRIRTGVKEVRKRLKKRVEKEDFEILRQKVLTLEKKLEKV